MTQMMLEIIFGRDGAIANDAFVILVEPDAVKNDSAIARLRRRNAPQ
jgi:hypothetical protein